jgi:hypothetical protein
MLREMFERYGGRVDSVNHRNGGLMGDKSPKSKERGQKQRQTAKANAAAAAQSKQDKQRRVPQGPAKPKS